MMKRLFVILIALSLAFICGCSPAAEQIVFPPDQTAKETAGGYKSKFSVKEKPLSSDTVYYFNPETKKFHTENCRYKTSCGENKTSDKQKLLNDGYSACKVCKP
ncbi:MAG: hypothetical protein KBS52_07425 [Clostridiales bacterium]|nr:hypothetical protein [Candidatus Equinaster intestinalis]